jgi:hypothetical protein
MLTGLMMQTSSPCATAAKARPSASAFVVEYGSTSAVVFAACSLTRPSAVTIAALLEV